MAYEQIIYEAKDPIAQIRLNRPAQLNAWTGRMQSEFREAIRTAEADPSVVVIVITGEGRGFCAGADLNDLRNLGGPQNLDRLPTRPSDGQDAASPGTGTGTNPGDPSMNPGFRSTYTYLMSVRKPIIAAINGPCAGMAIPIILCADVRFASDRAIFTTTFAQRGLIAEWGVAWLLPRVVGTGHAMDLLLSGRKIDASEAERIGLVNRAIPHDELLPYVLEYARELASNSAPRSMQVIKRQVYEALEHSLAQEDRNAAEQMLESFAREDFKEGVDAFIERRPPRFRRL